jgi:rhodanese-related sulfurtransferase
MAHSSRFQALCDAARKEVKECSVDDVKARVDAKESFVLLDVREESEFAAGHIPGARHLGKGIIERDIEKAVPDVNTEIVLYCGGGFRSALAGKTLKEMGYTNVKSMWGGITAWKGANAPVEK